MHPEAPSVKAGSINVALPIKHDRPSLTKPLRSVNFGPECFNPATLGISVLMIFIVSGVISVPVD